MLGDIAEVEYGVRGERGQEEIVCWRFFPSLEMQLEILYLYSQEQHRERVGYGLDREERDIINQEVAVQAGAGPEDDDLNGVFESWDQRGVRNQKRLRRLDE